MGKNLQIWYGVTMTCIEGMKLDRFIANNRVAMNTKTDYQRTEFVESWLQMERAKPSTP